MVLMVENLSDILPWWWRTCPRDNLGCWEPVRDMVLMVESLSEYDCSYLLLTIAKLSLNSTQLNSTSTQFEAEVSLNSTFSSHPPYHPATRKSSLSQIFHLLLEFHVWTKTCCLRYPNIIPHSCCRAQPQLNSTQPQLKLRVRLALIPPDPATHPPTRDCRFYTSWLFMTNSRMLQD